MRLKKNINLEDPILNSLNQHYENCMVDSKENYKFDLGVKGLRPACQTLMLPSIINTGNFASFTVQFLNHFFLDISNPFDYVLRTGIKGA